MSEQRCLDCGTREAAGAYCTACLGRNLDFFKRERSKAQEAAAVQARKKRASALKKTAKPEVL